MLLYIYIFLSEIFLFDPIDLCVVSYEPQHSNKSRLIGELR